MNRSVTVIWSGMLITTTVAVVPVVVNLLSRALAASRSIERYTVEILDGGVGIATNTSNVAALKETIGAAPLLLAGAESIERHAATIAGTLAKPGADGEEYG